MDPPNFSGFTTFPVARFSVTLVELHYNVFGKKYIDTDTSLVPGLFVCSDMKPVIPRFPERKWPNSDIV